MKKIGHLFILLLLAFGLNDNPIPDISYGFSLDNGIPTNWFTRISNQTRQNGFGTLQRH